MRLIKGLLMVLLMALSTLFYTLPLHVGWFFKIMSQRLPWQHFWLAQNIKIIHAWIHTTFFLFKLFLPTQFEVQRPEGLSMDESYLLISNHQNWADGFMLFKGLMYRVPFIRYFAKKQLRYYPFIGIGWTALDFPMMARHSKEALARDPSLREKDMQTTIASCRKFKNRPTAILNFLEGTRFTVKKRDLSQSPYENLLAPKAGGVAYTLAAFEGQIKTLLDVTVVYPSSTVNFIDFLMGKAEKVVIHIEAIPLPEWLLKGDYANDAEYRQSLKTFLSDRWQIKDRFIADTRKVLDHSTI